MWDKGLIQRLYPATWPLRRLWCLLFAHVGFWHYYCKITDQDGNGYPYHLEDECGAEWGDRECNRCGTRKLWTRPMPEEATERLLEAVEKA